jgi:tRNA G46 methylase TrmB
MDDRTFDDPKSAQEWISLVEKGQIRDTDINPRLKTWVDQSNAQDILEIGCGQGICSDKIDLSTYVRRSNSGT